MGGFIITHARTHARTLDARTLITRTMSSIGRSRSPHAQARSRTCPVESSSRHKVSDFASLSLLGGSVVRCSERTGFASCNRPGAYIMSQAENGGRAQAHQSRKPNAGYIPTLVASIIASFRCLRGLYWQSQSGLTRPTCHHLGGEGKTSRRSQEARTGGGARKATAVRLSPNAPMR
jgi:hypothetical protein